MGDYNKKLINLPFWSDLSKNEKEILNKSVTFKTFLKGESIFETNESCLGLLVVIEGAIRVSVISEEGREATLYTLNNGDICVMSASCVIHQIKLDTLILAKEDTEVMIVDSSTFDYLMNNNLKVKCYFYELSIERLNQALWVMQDILFERIDKRLAKYLVDEVEKTNSNIIYVTQEETAKEISSSREVVTRMLNHFASDGILEIHRGLIKIIDLEKLKEII